MSAAAAFFLRRSVSRALSQVQLVVLCCKLGGGAACMSKDWWFSTKLLISIVA